MKMNDSSGPHCGSFHKSATLTVIQNPTAGLSLEGNPQKGPPAIYVEACFDVYADPEPFRPNAEASVGSEGAVGCFSSGPWCRALRIGAGTGD